MRETQLAGKFDPSGLDATALDSLGHIMYLMDPVAKTASLVAFKLGVGIAGEPAGASASHFRWR
jgi:hypothetical protein